MTKLFPPRNVPAAPETVSLPAGDAMTALYLRGRAEWDERIGSLKAEKDSARKVAAFTLLILGLSVGGNVYQAVQSKIEVVAIEYDANNRAANVFPVNRSHGPTYEQIKVALEDWMHDIRVVYADVNAMNRALRHTHALVAKDSAASYTLAEHYEQSSPFERARTEVAEIVAINALPITHEPDHEGRQTWHVEWEERIKARDGRPIRTEAWKATLTFVITPPSSLDALASNPNRIFITDISWSRRSS